MAGGTGIVVTVTSTIAGRVTICLLPVRVSRKWVSARSPRDCPVDITLAGVGVTRILVLQAVSRQWWRLTDDRSLEHEILDFNAAFQRGGDRTIDVVVLGLKCLTYSLDVRRRL